MSDLNSTFADPPVAEKSFPWGCLLGGCLSVVALFVIGILATGYAGYRFYKGQLDAYTSEQPAVIPAVDSTAEEIAAVKQRVEDFKKALEQEEAPEQLVLTADEINALISGEKELNGRLFVQIEDGEIMGEASFPADILPLGKGRYFNGSVSLKASLENGVLIVTIDHAEVNGKPVPEEFMTELRNQNLAKDAYKDPQTAEFLRKFERLTIEDDKIILTPAEKKAGEPSTEGSLEPNAEPASAADSAEANSAKAEITAHPDFKPSDND